jgi:hypothetical protein
MTLTGVALADCKYPSVRLAKLKERSLHIDEQIKELRDKKRIIEHEIVETLNEINEVR